MSLNWIVTNAGDAGPDYLTVDVECDCPEGEPLRFRLSFGSTATHQTIRDAIDREVKARYSERCERGWIKELVGARGSTEPDAADATGGGNA